MHPVVYQFCSNCHGMRNSVPDRFKDLHRFCGALMLFDSESRAKVRELPPDHVTRYDLVLSELMSRYGKTEKFSRRGRVTVEYADDPVDSFFFSSRRRHTRFDCDWSSDVCSSDLLLLPRTCGTRAGPTTSATAWR